MSDAAVAGGATRRRLLRRFIPRTPEGLLATGFATLVLVGALVLWLPWSHHGAVGPLEALFTATSAVCVTGLTVVDTGAHLTFAGQLVVLVLIQVGGLGVMTFAALAFRMLGRRLSLRGQAALHDAVAQGEIAHEFRSLFRHVLALVLGVELAGALVLYVGLSVARADGGSDAAGTLWSALFHAISAFCNAGFSLHPDSLASLRGQPLVIGAILLLVVLGGIGHPVLVDIWNAAVVRRLRAAPRVHRLSLHTRVVLVTTVALLGGGALLLFASGVGPDTDDAVQRCADALFLSVSSRTAGFATVDSGALPLASLLVVVMLMFVGGSPASCAGGIKTTTFALWLAKLRSRLGGAKSPVLFNRHIAGEFTRRASLIMGLAVCWNAVGLLVLAAAEGGRPDVGLADLLFEQVSAFGTVGLSTGITPELGVVGRLWTILTMFVGRVGPLSLAVWAFARRAPGVRYPEGKVLLG